MQAATSAITCTHENVSAHVDCTCAQLKPARVHARNILSLHRANSSKNKYTQICIAHVQLRARTRTRTRTHTHTHEWEPNCPRHHRGVRLFMCRSAPVVSRSASMHICLDVLAPHDRAFSHLLQLDRPASTNLATAVVVQVP